MRKLTLNLDQLAVDSFNTVAERRSEGTVFGEQCTCYTNCTCPGCPTCDVSCDGTCGDTCGDSCGGSCGDSCYHHSCNYCPTHQDPTCGYGTCAGAQQCWIVN